MSPLQSTNIHLDLFIKFCISYSDKNAIGKNVIFPCRENPSIFNKMSKYKVNNRLMPQAGSGNQSISDSGLCSRSRPTPSSPPCPAPPATGCWRNTSFTPGTMRSARFSVCARGAPWNSKSTTSSRPSPPAAAEANGDTPASGPCSAHALAKSRA